MTRQAYEELLKVDDECAPWAKAQPGFVQDTTDDELAVVDTITNQHPGWVQETLNAADPFIIAQAVEQELVVVTFERRRGSGSRSTTISRFPTSPTSGKSSASTSRNSRVAKAGSSRRRVTAVAGQGVWYGDHGVPCPEACTDGWARRTTPCDYYTP